MTEAILKYIQEDLFKKNVLNKRQINILKSPKKGGSSDIDAYPYLKDLGLEIEDNKQPIQFAPNINEHIHRWAPYVQGFSASFVQTIFDRYKKEYGNPVVLDPFSGCGTVLVQAKLNGFKSFGTELNPLLQFIADTKVNCWDISPAYLIKIFQSLPKSKVSPAPLFLKSYSHFDKEILKNLEIIKGSIETIEPASPKMIKAIDLIKLAFSSILIECSNLKRSPCLGYSKNKRMDPNTPFVLLKHKINNIAFDLQLIKNQFEDFIYVYSKVALANAMDYAHELRYDLVITSPPYMNGLDYVMNYKIEMGWLDFVKNQKELKKIKDSMVVCDNVSKGLINNFKNTEKEYSNDWIERIKNNIKINIEKRGSYRRNDMPSIVHKYFSDLYKVIRNVLKYLNPGGRFILVVGDSLIADEYVPTDLLIAKIGLDLGLEIEKIEKARERRSGQIRSYKLRESIITLRR
jgi:hypothetical protein